MLCACRSELAVKGLRQLEKRFSESPEVLARVAVTHLKVLLQSRQSAAAKQLLAQLHFGVCSPL